MAENAKSEEWTTVIKRIQTLEDKEAIRDLMVRYSLNADLNHAEEFANLWTEDGVWDVGAELGGLFKGRDQIKQFFNGPVHQSLTNHSQHLNLDFIIDVEGDLATGVGYFIATVHWQGGFGIYKCSLRRFRFRRVEGQWLIQEMVTRTIGSPQCQSIMNS